MDPRTRRIAENESRFRDINERLGFDLHRLPGDPGPVDFVCECGMVDCAQPVSLALPEYEHVRSDPLLFAVVPGHELLDVEDVVERTDRYAIVRKHRESADLVKETDPRS